MAMFAILVVAFLVINVPVFLLLWLFEMLNIFQVSNSFHAKHLLRKSW